jgi:hypothetical protein
MIPCIGHPNGYDKRCHACQIKNAPPHRSVVQIHHQSQFVGPPRPANPRSHRQPTTRILRGKPELHKIKLTTQQLWAKLHLYSFEVDEWEQSKAKNWYQEWKRLVTQHYGCTGCGSHWAKITAKNPPDFTTRESFFSWTVARHNDVNIHLSKPIFPISNATELHCPMPSRSD